MIAIPLSRVYLGVHFPTDLLGGYVLGALILMGFWLLAPPLEAWLAGRRFGTQLLIAVGVPLLFLLLSFVRDKAVLSMVGALMGVCVGLALERRFVRFSCAGRRRQKLLRYLLGAAVLLGFWAGLKAAFSGLEPAGALRFVRYGLAGLWGGMGAPWLFVRLGLADTEEQ
jgi:hypothetical protein